MRRFIQGLLLLGLTGCVYYNGVYNARRLAKSATKAEKDGRTLEASGYWGQVAVKAESVIVRHPRSQWVEEANFWLGKARARTGDCAGAGPSLEYVLTTSTKAKLVEEAADVLGACRLTLGDLAGAASAYGRITGSRDATRRSVALYYHGRSLSANGQYADALVELEASRDPRAQGERAIALAALGRLPESLALVDSMLARADTTDPWSPLFAALATQDPAAASALVDRLAALPWPTRNQRARWLLEDGRRLVATDSARALQRLVLADSAGGPAGVEARFTVVRWRLDAAATPAALAAELPPLDDAAGQAGPFAAQAEQLAKCILRLVSIADSTRPGVPEGDLRLFLAAELARDGTLTPRLAGALFRRLAADWPASPFAPKALLALSALEPATADSTLALAEARYADSPYLAMLRGESTPGYRALEDSLRYFATSDRLEPRRPTRVRTQPKPGAGVQPPADN